MKIGLSVYDIAPGDLVELTCAAESAGFDSLWLGEHVVLPVGYESEHPSTARGTPQHHTGPIIDAFTTLVDPLVALSAAAAATTRIRLATGIYLLPLRHPISVARAVSTLQQLARGRFILGVGAGWLREEFDALGISFEERGSRLDESIGLLRRLLASEVVHHSGHHFQFGPVQLGQPPVAVPLALGGNSAPALRRAVRTADGWLSSGTPSFDEAIALRDAFDNACSQLGRVDAPTQWYRVADAGGDTIDRYADAGFEHVVIWADQLWPRVGSPPEKRDSFAATIERLGLAARLVSDDAEVRPPVPLNEERSWT